MSIDVTPPRAASLSERVAEEIRVILARRQIRQSQLARIIGVNEQWLSVRLRGVQPIDLNDLDRIARALQLSVADLLPEERDVQNTDPFPGMSESTRPVRVRPRDNRPPGRPPAEMIPPAVRRPAPIPRTPRPRSD